LPTKKVSVVYSSLTSNVHRSGRSLRVTLRFAISPVLRRAQAVPPAIDEARRCGEQKHGGGRAERARAAQGALPPWGLANAYRLERAGHLLRCGVGQLGALGALEDLLGLCQPTLFQRERPGEDQRLQISGRERGEPLHAGREPLGVFEP